MMRSASISFLSAALVGALLFSAGLIVVPAARGAEDVTTTYFEQLRRRGLFSVAEGYCLDKLASKEISDNLRARLTLELSRTLAEHARHSSGEESAELFDRAQQVLDEHLRKFARHPQRLLLEVQRALLPAGRGEFLRWQSEIFPHDAKLHAQAIATLDEAIAKLTGVERILAERLRATGAARGNDNEIKPHEARSLLNNVRFELGTANVERAKLFASGSAERVAGLLEADEWLRRLSGGPKEEELTWRSQLKLAEANRLRGDHKQALAMLAAIEKEGPPQGALDDVTAQRARIQIDEGRPDEAARTLVTYGHTRPGLPGELQFLRVRAVLGMWEVAVAKKSPENASLPDELFEQMKADVSRAEKEVGGYWAYRCRMLLDSAQETVLYGGEIAELVRAARAAFAAGDIDAAVDQYTRAAARAAKSGREDQAFELGYTRSSMLLQAQRHEAAAAAFRELAAKFPKQPRAAEAHLLGAWCLGKLFEKSADERQRNEFAAALAAHRKAFPGHATTIDATWMLAALDEQRGEFESALKLYAEIPAAHPHGLEAQAAAARCYEAILEKVRTNGQLRASWEQEGIRQLEKFAATFPAEPAPLALPQGELSLRLARILLKQSRPDYVRADRILARIFASAPRPNAEKSENQKTNQTVAGGEAWQPLIAQGAQLRIVSLAGQQRWDQAEAFVRRLSDASPGEVLSILDGLMQVGASIEPTARRGLGNLQLKAAEELARRRTELNAADAQRLDRCLAQAYLATNQPTKAIAIYESLVERNPRDLPLVKTVAGLLMDCGTAECAEKSLAFWRKIEAAEKQGSRAWLEASYSIARCSLRLKRFDECRKILGVTKVLYPEMGGPDLKAKFETLRKELERADESGR